MNSRKQNAQSIRDNAAQIAAQRPHPRHLNNGEELRYRRPEDYKEPSYIANFTKGLPHCTVTGLLLNPADYRQLILGIQSGDNFDFAITPLGPATVPAKKGCLSNAKITCENPGIAGVWESQLANDTELLMSKPGLDKVADVRAWESQAAGLLYDLEGPDAQSVTMPPAPTLDSHELCAEMAEIYLMSLLRDVHFSNFRTHCLGETVDLEVGKDCRCVQTDVDTAIDMLCQLDWFKNDCCSLNEFERKRHRNLHHVTKEHVFRGIAPGDEVGPYISQFLLLGNAGINGCDDTYTVRQNSQITENSIAYGALRVSPKVRVAVPCKDYMTTFENWVDVQNGADLRGLELYDQSPTHRYITTPRDLATYVHYDALYEAYLNSCLLLLGMGTPFDPGLPFLKPDVADKQQGFASFGGPHILSLVTEVATRALKAVRYQKFNIHRRLRPEALAGLIDRYKTANFNPEAVKELEPVCKIANKLDEIGLLDLIKDYNAFQNTASDRSGDASAGFDRYFLPMAFPEGSPMHPSYGAGHATVAGACVTILKAFFDCGWKLADSSGNAVAYEANHDGSSLVPLTLSEPLTVEGELNKLAANIAIGRDWAGVHYFTDYIESLRLGEQIALGVLEEQRLCYHENFTMTIRLFDGNTVRI